ncbi:hypothetical protein ACE418_13345 [Megasphaera sp. WILCCON 0056]|uniref:hypothetical protein n=1 Tax=Megasphaera sp. WILCCON 0056 TaxID=3345340 RepID=UPI003A7F6982
MLHDKTIFSVSIFTVTFGYIIWLFLKSINKTYLYYYKYSVPYLLGGVVSGISILGIVAAIILDGISGEIFFVLFGLGFMLFSYAESNLDKHIHDADSYKKHRKEIFYFLKYSLLLAIVMFLKKMLNQ